MTEQNNIPAFPLPATPSSPMIAAMRAPGYQEGMTLRDYFAG